MQVGEQFLNLVGQEIKISAFMDYLRSFSEEGLQTICRLGKDLNLEISKKQDSKQTIKQIRILLCAYQSFILCTYFQQRNERQFLICWFIETSNMHHQVISSLHQNYQMDVVLFHKCIIINSEGTSSFGSAFQNQSLEKQNNRRNGKFQQNFNILEQKLHQSDSAENIKEIKAIDHIDKILQTKSNINENMLEKIVKELEGKSQIIQKYIESKEKGISNVPLDLDQDYKKFLFQMQQIIKIKVQIAMKMSRNLLKIKILQNQSQKAKLKKQIGVQTQITVKEQILKLQKQIKRLHQKIQEEQRKNQQIQAQYKNNKIQDKEKIILKLNEQLIMWKQKYLARSCKKTNSIFKEKNIQSYSQIIPLSLNNQTNQQRQESYNSLKMNLPHRTKFMPIKLQTQLDSDSDRKQNNYTCDVQTQTIFCTSPSKNIKKCIKNSKNNSNFQIKQKQKQIQKLEQLKIKKQNEKFLLKKESNNSNIFLIQSQTKIIQQYSKKKNSQQNQFNQQFINKQKRLNVKSSFHLAEKIIATKSILHKLSNNPTFLYPLKLDFNRKDLINIFALDSKRGMFQSLNFKPLKQRRAQTANQKVTSCTIISNKEDSIETKIGTYLFNYRNTLQRQGKSTFKELNDILIFLQERTSNSSLPITLESVIAVVKSINDCHKKCYSDTENNKNVVCQHWFKFCFKIGIKL